MRVRATTGACTLEDGKVVGKGLFCSLEPLNYRTAVRIVMLCVNIPVFSGGDSDLESTVHSPRSRFLASQPPHTQGQGWSTGAREQAPRAGLPVPPQSAWHLSTAGTSTCTSQTPRQPEYTRGPQLLCCPHASACLPAPHASPGPV